MNQEEVKKVMSEMGKRGGQTTKKKYGKKHYQDLAAHMNKVRAEKKTQAVKKPLNMPFE